MILGCATGKLEAGRGSSFNTAFLSGTRCLLACALLPATWVLLFFLTFHFAHLHPFSDAACLHTCIRPCNVIVNTNSFMQRLVSDAYSEPQYASAFDACLRNTCLETTIVLHRSTTTAIDLSLLYIDSSTFNLWREERYNLPLYSLNESNEHIRRQV